MTDKEIIKALEYYQSIDIIKSGLDLINRQQAEIEELKKVVIDDYASEYDSKIRAEAIKEFAENIKLEFYKEFDEIIPSIMADKIDNLVKEMVGGQE